jgi:hypothetical protein
MVIFVNDKKGDTRRFDASSVVVQDIIFVSEQKDGSIEVKLPACKSKTTQVVCNFGLFKS